ncbi:MAG: flagellar biosynthetic protein FliQ [Myxococcales bacterium]|jgi:flagellar biosynthetic protein FliQ
MDESALILIGREALLLMVLASAPPLLASLVAGALFSTLQAITSVHEPTLAVVPKLIAAILSLVVAGPWIGAQLGRFSSEVFKMLPGVGR